MIFQQINVGASVIFVLIFFCVVFTDNPIFYITFMIQGHIQGQKVNFKVR